MKKQILMIGNSHLSIFDTRGELIKSFISKGYDVTVAFPNGPYGQGEESAETYHCKFVETPLNKRGKNPLQEIKLLIQYNKLIRSGRPDAVLTYTVKCNLYGGLLCRLYKIPYMPNITGIGSGLAKGGLTSKCLIFLHKIAMKHATCIFFQNQGDRDFFKTKKIRHKTDVLLPGSGVNLQKYSVLPYPSDGKTVFTYVGRVMAEKGIHQYLEAARNIRKKYPNAEFHICGHFEEDYKDVLKRESSLGNIRYHGLVDDIIKYVKASHCIVLPTYYPEGMSNALLEGAACGRPLIATDRYGCREIVENGVTGYLVRERDAQDLQEKMIKFINLSYEDKEKMGLLGRKKVEKEFDRKLVVRAYMHEIENCF